MPPERTKTKGRKSPADENSAVGQIDQPNQFRKKMMVSDDKKIKANLAPKTESAPENSVSGLEPSKAEGGETGTVPSGYSRGEGERDFRKEKRNDNACVVGPIWFRFGFYYFAQIDETARIARSPPGTGRCC
jgi:hypothetical protein